MAYNSSSYNADLISDVKIKMCLAYQFFELLREESGNLVGVVRTFGAQNFG